MAIRFLNSQSIDGELTVTGNVGIGTTSPGAALTVGDSTSTGNHILVEGSSSDNTYTVFEGKRKYPKLILNDTIGSSFSLWNLGNTLRFGTNVGSAANAAWYTKSGNAADVIFNGNVGIGTTSPEHLLDVQGTTDPSIRVKSTGTGNSDDSSIRMTIGGTTANNRIRFGDATTSTAGQLMYSHSSNAMRFYTSATEKVRIDSSGNVGIGNASPENILHVEKANPIIFVQDTDTSLSTTEAYIKFSGSQSSAAGGGFRTDVEKAIGYKEDSLVFEDGGTERMRIDSSGDVGIGTTNPSLSYGGKGLQIQNTDTAGLRLTDTTGADFDISARSGDVLLYEGNGKTIRIGVGGSEKMRIQNDGYVGIGTTSPSALLDVEGESGTISSIDLSNTDVDLRLSSYTDSHAEIRVASDHDLRFKTNGNNERMTIGNDGNVGIGTNNPDKLLVVSGDGAEIVINDTDATDNPRIRLRESGATSGSIYTDASELIFDSGTSEKMRIDSSGNVGIGTTNPVYLLDVQATSDPSIRVRSSGTEYSNDALVRIQIGGTTASSYIFFGDSSDTDAGSIRYRHSEDSLQFRVNAAERMRISSTGNVGIGTTSPASKLQVDGGDIEVDDRDSGLILRSPDGTRYRITVANGGTLTVTAV